MGLNTSSNRKYLGIWYGRLCMTSKEQREGFELRKVKVDDGVKEKWVFNVRSVTGKIVAIYYKVSEVKFGDGKIRNVVLVMEDNGEEFAINLPFEREGSELIKKIPNLLKINPSEDVTFSISSDDKDRSVFVKVESSGEYVKNFYTKDNPNGMPPPEKVQEVGEDDKWSYKKQSIFLHKQLTEEFKEKLSVFSVNSASGSPSHSGDNSDDPGQEGQTEPETVSSANAEDDLPF